MDTESNVIIKELNDYFEAGKIDKAKGLLKEYLKSKKKRGLLLQARDASLKTALHLVVEFKCSEAVDMLLASSKDSKEGIDINARDIRGKTALACSARAKDEATFRKLLITYNAQIDQKSFDYACREFCSSTCLDLLRFMLSSSNDVKINGSDIEAEAPLHCAAMNTASIPVEGLQGAKLITSFLLDNGAFPDVLSKKKDTPLHYAVLNKNDDVIRLLLLAGADMDIKGHGSISPLELAERHNLHSLSLFLLAKEIRNYLQNCNFTEEEPYRKIFAEFFNRDIGKREFMSIFSMNKEKIKTIFKFSTHTIDILVDLRESLLDIDKIDADIIIPPISIMNINTQISDLESNASVWSIEQFFKLSPKYNEIKEDTSVNIDAEKRLRTRVKLWNLKINDIPRNSDCLFQSVLKQLPLEYKDISVDDIRRDCVAWLVKHKIFSAEDYVNFNSVYFGTQKISNPTPSLHLSSGGYTLSSSDYSSSYSRNTLIGSSDSTVYEYLDPPCEDYKEDAEEEQKQVEVAEEEESEEVTDIYDIPSEFKKYCSDMVTNTNKTNYGDLLMLVAISELYFAKIFVITSTNSSKYCGVICPKYTKRSFYLGAHLDSLYFLPLCERKENSIPSNWNIDISDIEYPATRQILGQGAQGWVEKAKYKGSNVAVKIRNSPSDSNPNLQAYFEPELHATKILRHPNIVQFRGCYLSPNLSMMVSELMENGSLRDFINSKEGQEKLQSNNILKYKIAKNIASALLYIHKSNYIHCDLTSNNVLLDEDLRAKVSDLGLARKINDTSNKQTGHVWWCAPELLQKEKTFSIECDVYSFGVILWEMVSFKVPGYLYNQTTTYMNAILNGYRPAIPESCELNWKTLIEMCWHREKSKRPNFESILSLLEK